MSFYGVRSHPPTMLGVAIYRANEIGTLRQSDAYDLRIIGYKIVGFEDLCESTAAEREDPR
jgi:hypothetical protein